ncbi:hypothetical protein ACF061_04055 [Streptomyces sp. NPDC015220]|uniref:hypothetical protein n=1 Tax=Streptomyces sp. NPDC015220 TaxID=3364947 RepID=UPI0036F8E3E1
MLNSRKIAVAAGVLWSVALIGGGAAQAFAHDGSGGSSGSGSCVQDGSGNVRCEQKMVYRDERGNVHVVADQSQSCTGGPCGSTFVVGDRKS